MIARIGIWIASLGGGALVLLACDRVGRLGALGAILVGVLMVWKGQGATLINVADDRVTGHPYRTPGTVVPTAEAPSGMAGYALGGWLLLCLFTAVAMAVGGGP